MGENEDEQPVSRAVKFVGKDTIEGLAIPFGGLPGLKGKDVHREAFDASTDLCEDWFPTRPLLYEHGLDKAHKAAKVGVQVEYEVRDSGVWQQSQLDVNAKYRKAIDALIEEGALGYSSGAYGHLATKNAQGIITRWPWVETSLTPTPANPLTLGVHYVKSAEVLDLFPDDDLPEPLKAAFAALDNWALTRDPDATLATESLDEKAGRVTAAGLDLREHVTAYAAMRAKAGRVLSTATRERLMSHPSLLRELADDLDGLLREADAPKEGKSADLWLEAIRTERALSRHLGLD